MKQIELTQSQVAIVDTNDYTRLTDMGKWYAAYSPKVRGFYAVRQIRKLNGKQQTIRMHRVIINAPSNKEVDHINHNTLDNRMCNLRICTKNENQHNRKPNKQKTSSNYKGVSLDKHKIKNKMYSYWRAQINFNGKLLPLGYFNSEIDAAKAYNNKAIELFGEFALLNEVFL